MGEGSGGEGRGEREECSIRVDVQCPVVGM